jgi:hypothetical protein
MEEHKKPSNTTRSVQILACRYPKDRKLLLVIHILSFYLPCRIFHPAARLHLAILSDEPEWFSNPDAAG